MLLMMSIVVLGSMIELGMCSYLLFTQLFSHIPD